MNILFIYSLQEIESPEKPLVSQEQIQFGISYISAVLKKHGHQTKLVILSRTSSIKNNREIISDSIEGFKPKLFCFTAVSSEYHFIKNIAKYLKSHYSDAYFLIGGVHVTLNPEGVLEDGFDALCIGEGEYPVLELADYLKKGAQPTGIPNLWIKQDNKIEKNPTREFLNNLDELPFPDRDMWQRWIKERSDSQHSVLLGRGCPFECSYCCNHALKKKASGNYIRLRSTDNIINEIKDLAKKYPENKNIYLEIETVNINRDWAIELCSKLFDLNKTLDEPLRFGINLRITPHENYEHIFSAFQKSNFKFINIGLESGSERIRRDILRRNYSNSDVINAVKSGRRHNLQIAFYNIIGIPGETIRDHQETIRMNRLCQPDWIMATIFFPYPGTDLYALCRSKGYMKGTIDTEMERCRAVLDIPDFSKKQIQSAYEWFYYNVYKNHKPLHVLIVRTFVAKLRRWPRFFRIYLLIARQDMYRKLKSFLKDKSIFKD